ncbi:MAG TPA: TetR/AcrR family transcriptional regulator [Stellaceae bacterium]|nr:TetR/AcrR family transcriptional regulator [Stellaceae bacterium]
MRGQIKKEALRRAILSAAFELFARNGYANTTIGQIARDAGTAQGNVYHYFDSKFEIFITLFHPWFESKIDRLENRLARVRDPRRRLRAVLLALWRDIPREDNGFQHNLVQALATKRPEERYSRVHLHHMETRVAGLIRPYLPAGRRFVFDDNLFPNFAFMASDGFTIAHGLSGLSPRAGHAVEMMCDLLLPRTAARPARRPAPRPRAAASRLRPVPRRTRPAGAGTRKGRR